MVSDLLEFARLSRTEIAIETVLLADAIEDMRTILHTETHNAGAELCFDVPDDLRVKAHRQTLVQALNNLVSNAVKFVTPGTTPVVSVGARQTGGVVRVTVEDNGIGILDSAQGRIFNVFERLHGEEEYPGTGIGLAIVKKGIERMGGSVGVSSAPGAGSVFHVELPAAQDSP